MWYVRGETTNANDPLFTPDKAGRRIHKLVVSDESLIETIKRWTELGRVIDHVSAV